MKWREFILAIPTTKVRVLVGIGLTVWTAYHVLEDHWVPDAQWLVFLAASNGIDIGQYAINKANRPKEQNNDETLSQKG